MYTCILDKKCPSCGLLTLETNGVITRCASSCMCSYGWPEQIISQPYNFKTLMMRAWTPSWEKPIIKEEKSNTDYINDFFGLQ